ncbi:MAG: diaminopimelate epimerase [Alphaproteobacteria bacterium]|nr:diaminopimelate epimerase [Alphaproteobacteria bacterium]
MKDLTLSFIKASALGNDFVILSAIEEEIDLGALSVLLSDRREGIGCDQVIFIEDTSNKEEFKVRFFNADGSEAEACGNGTRCVSKILMDQTETEEVFIDTAGGYLKCRKAADNKISVKMSFPQWNADINLREYQKISDPAPVFVDLGNPHLICFVEDVDHISTLGPILEEHLYKHDTQFPERLNVGFVRLLDKETIALKVWERGSGLTPACGSGACAAVVAAKARGLVSEKVNVYQEGGGLEINFNGSDLFMTGEAKIIYSGEIIINPDMLEAIKTFQPLDEVYAGTIVLVQLSPEGDKESYEIFADFGEFGRRKTTAALANSYEMTQLFGKAIAGVLSEDDSDSFTLLGYLDEEDNILLMDRPPHLKNGERITNDAL